tara:strand:- start:830 stop:1393 length:564 start_codon:yes stop_codon:yes gene_type:complete
MKKFFFSIVILFFTHTNLTASTFDDLKNIKKTSYLDFLLLKIESRLIQRHGLLGAQPMALRIQYQSIGSAVNFSENDSKVIISILGVMDKKRYTKKKYTPKISDCNILRNLLLYGKYGYNLIFQKRNKFLTNADMEEIFVSKFLNNFSLSDKEKKYITNNTIVKSEIIDPVRGNDISCTGKVAEDLK